MRSITRNGGLAQDNTPQRLVGGAATHPVPASDATPAREVA